MSQLNTKRINFAIMWESDAESRDVPGPIIRMEPLVFIFYHYFYPKRLDFSLLRKGKDDNAS
jgi:hypothetical protein